MTPEDTMTAEEIAAWEQQLRSQQHEEPVAVLREWHVRALKHRLWRAARKARQ